MNAETPPEEGGISKVVTAKRDLTQTTRSVSHSQVLARSGALAIATSATAAGAFKSSKSMLEATATLATSLYVDL